jgi:hypothetical protein
VAIHGSKSVLARETSASVQDTAPSPVIDSLVSLRGSVRQTALVALKEIKSLKKKARGTASSSAEEEQYAALLGSYEKTLSDMMAACDETRRHLATEIGIEILDLSEKSVWKMGSRRSEERRDPAP